eukprot:365725-Chlamydomonas_euryale.AAC.40
MPCFVCSNSPRRCGTTEKGESTRGRKCARCDRPPCWRAPAGVFVRTEYSLCGLPVLGQNRTPMRGSLCACMLELLGCHATAHGADYTLPTRRFARVTA